MRIWYRGPCVSGTTAYWVTVVGYSDSRVWKSKKTSSTDSLDNSRSYTDDVLEAATTVVFI